MLSDQEKRELREMGESASLRSDFRIMRHNSQEIAQGISINELAGWLTSINRICPIDPKSRRPIREADMRL